LYTRRFPWSRPPWPTRDPDVAAAKDLFASLSQLPEVQYHLDDMLSGMGIRYPVPGSDDRPPIGLPAPDLDLGPTRLHELLRSGRGILLDPLDKLADLADPWSDRIDRTGHGADTEPMLIRPDGYVCWTTGPGHSTDGLESALGHWFGDPHR